MRLLRPMLAVLLSVACSIGGTVLLSAGPWTDHGARIAFDALLFVPAWLFILGWRSPWYRPVTGLRPIQVVQLVLCMLWVVFFVLLMRAPSHAHMQVLLITTLALMVSSLMNLVAFMRRHAAAG